MGRGVIVGTAGHIDHGKTTLVRALTGVDTDRLPEEKRRGITIELGFAPLELPGVGTAGVVDVPGHEAFVRTMVAGATGVDVALVVVAADEGVMPQTREHLAILDLLGVRRGVVALTKADLVDPDWLALVEDDVRLALAGSPLADAPVLAVSATTGAGIDDLRAALAAAAGEAGARDDGDLFRLPVDRAFSVRGTGTVVTGTVWSGALARDASVRVLPGGHVARVRGLQSHGAAAERVTAGSRAAIALAGVDVEQVGRGSVIVADASWHPTRLLRADVTLLDDAPALGPRTRVRFHLGTVEVGARVVSPGGALAPGESRGARVVLDAPVVARGGDRFVLRSASPLVTIGGGTVTDPLPPTRRPRPWPAADPGEEAADAVARRLGLAVREAGGQGIDRATLAVRLGVAPAGVRALVDGATGIRVVGGRLYDEAAAAAASAAVTKLVDEEHRRAPLEPGTPLQSVRARLGVHPELVEETLRQAVASGEIEIDGAAVRRRGWTPQLTAEQRALAERLAAALAAAAQEPPSVGELTAAHGPAVPTLLRLLERDGRAVQVEPDRYYDTAALASAVARLRESTEPGRTYGPSELREMLGVSRKFLIPLLEYCDRAGVTDRRADGRAIRGT